MLGISLFITHDLITKYFRMFSRQLAQNVVVNLTGLSRLKKLLLINQYFDYLPRSTPEFFG